MDLNTSLIDFKESHMGLKRPFYKLNRKRCKQLTVTRVKFCDVYLLKAYAGTAMSIGADHTIFSHEVLRLFADSGPFRNKFHKFFKCSWETTQSCL